MAARTTTSTPVIASSDAPATTASVSAATEGVGEWWTMSRRGTEQRLLTVPGAAYRRRVSFEVAGEAYDRFMGRYSQPLALGFADLLEVTAGQRALDVGCGPGALTAPLVDRLGSDQ